jgi:hypothetical protein
MNESSERDDALRGDLRALSESVRAPQGLAQRLLDATAAPTSEPADSSPARGARRQWVGRWMVPLGSAAAVLAVVFAGTVVHGRLSSPAATSWQAGTVVPWKSAPLPLDPQGLKNLPEQAAPAVTRPCMSSDFALVSAGSDLSTGGPLSVQTYYVLRSTSASACAASVYGLGVVFVDAAGFGLANDNAGERGPYMGPDPLVAPGQLLSGSVNWNWYPGFVPRPERLLILPAEVGTKPTSGLQVPLGDVDVPQPPGSSSTSWHMVWATGLHPSVSDPGSLSSLAVVLHVPPSVPVGKVLNYTVDLQNRTDTAVPLDPCPDLTGVLSTNRLKSYFDASYEGVMNCAQGPPVIAPHSSVTYAMELNTTGTIATAGQLTWTLVLHGYRIAGASTLVDLTP